MNGNFHSRGWGDHSIFIHFFFYFDGFPYNPIFTAFCAIFLQRYDRREINNISKRRGINRVKFLKKVPPVQFVDSVDVTCDLDVVCRDLPAPAVHPAVPGAGVACLQPGDGEREGGRVQPDPRGVDQRSGAQLGGEDGHTGVLDGGERGAGPGAQRLGLCIEITSFPPL